MKRKQKIKCSECPRWFNQTYHTQKTCSLECSRKRDKRIAKLYRDKGKKIKKEDVIKIVRSGNTDFGDGFSIFINGRWVIDASCFTKDFKVSLDNRRMKKIREDNPKDPYSKVTYVWDKRFKK